MRTQRSIFERAKQGDPEAIATIVQNSLDRQDITAQVSLENGCLQIVLESPRKLDQQATVQSLHRDITDLATPLIKSLQVYTRYLGEIGEETAAWQWNQELISPEATQSESLPQSEQVAVVSHSSRRSHQFMFTGAVAIAALIGVNLFWGFRSIFKLQGESQAYADKAIAQIIGTWNSDALVNRATPEFLVQKPQTELEQTFGDLSGDLGKLQRHEDVRCNVTSSRTSQGKQTISDCQAMLVFEKSPATVEIELVHHEEQWQINGFYIHPNGLP